MKKYRYKASKWISIRETGGVLSNHSSQQFVPNFHFFAGPEDYHSGKYVKNLKQLKRIKINFKTSMSGKKATNLLESFKTMKLHDLRRLASMKLILLVSRV